MLSKLAKNYSINLLLGIMTTVCAGTGFLLYFKPGSIMQYLVKIPIMSFHIWTGFIMTGAVLLHLLLHAKWIKTVTKEMVSNKKGVLALVVTVFMSIGIFYAIVAMNPAQGPIQAPTREGYHMDRPFRYGNGNPLEHDKNYIDESQGTQDSSDV
ncbi:DUF4405 domain-containing protein [Desulfotomaculum nigrificans]|uniref:DUF4405 domain-containing protein n=1 Tax=Desulfotomaculum nigrificans TaxID=1565 RepID=UPI0001FAECA5|nr:DUF4405 domain-containing protein [Desulfotomaculum nigrificans]